MEEKLLTYSKTERNTFLVSLLGQNILYGIVTAAFAYYLQFVVLIPAAVLGTVMAATRVFDALNDPLMGVVVDRTNSRYGKCRPYLMVAPGLLLITTILCFWAPFGVYTRAGSPGLVIAWAVISYLLWEIAYTIGDIPIWGITALITENDAHRNKLMSSGRLLCNIGIGFGYIIQPLALLLSGSMGGELNSFLFVAVLFSFLGSALFQVFGFTAREKITPSEQPVRLRENVKILWSSRPFRQILVSGVLASPKTLIMSAIFPLFTYYYASKDFMTLVLYLVPIGMCLFAGMFIAIGLTPRLLTRFSKKKLYNYSNLIAVLPSALIFVLYLLSPAGMTSWYNVSLLSVCFAFVGFGMGIPMVMQSVMIADCVDDQEYKTGLRPDGVFFSGQSFIAKMQNAVATMLSGAAFACVGFSDQAIERVNAFIAEGGVPRSNPDFAPYMMILFFLVSVPPAIGYLLSVIPTWNYALDTDEHRRILEELNQRRREQRQLSEECI
ncbi:MAG: MFS transporter [Oscillospiraceae bacterium]|nr:MFS transporter [Oscillospiraceae bacterium]